jgi:plasmid stabilization system protein ParE
VTRRGSGFDLTPLAQSDLTEIADWIEAHDEAAATRFLGSAGAAFALLARRPGLGHRRPDLTPLDLRFWPLRRRWLIVYRDTSPLQIIRVLNAWRDVAAVLTDTPDEPA